MSRSELLRCQFELEQFHEQRTEPGDAEVGGDEVRRAVREIRGSRALILLTAIRPEPRPNSLSALYQDGMDATASGG